MDDLTDPPLRPLPARAVRLLERVAAPPRPVAHLRAVHDVAAQLVDRVPRHCPGLEFDSEAVLFGAATHRPRVRCSRPRVTVLAASPRRRRR
ncbi:hypothetical protein ACH5A3_09305 [Streptomyces echinatus]|uniref:hypothetical protein n=1 Tax=Streptomyces echinatus TaxID=67293 RepID=UPI0037947C1E